VVEKVKRVSRNAGAVWRTYIVAYCMATCAAPADAQETADQDVSPNLSVAERFGQNFGVDGIRSGSFLLFPTLTYAQIYDNNIFSDPVVKTDDFIADINASLALRSDWDIHGVDVVSSVRRLQYFDTTSESTTDYGVLGHGVFDLSRRSIATFTGGYARSTEARRSLQTVFGEKPVQFSVLTAAADFDLRQTRFREQFGVAYRKDNYNDVATLGGLGVIDQDFRDREVVAAYFRQSFRVRPTVALFAEANADHQRFTSDQAVLGVRQDSDGYGGSVGVALDINKVARGEVGVGYQKRNYDDPLFEDISGLNVNAELEYFLSDLTTVRIEAERSIQNTALIGVAGYYANGGTLTVEHELLRSLMLIATADYRRDDFRGIDRNDELLRFSGGADYAFRRNIVLSARYIYLDVKSSGAAARPGFDESVIRVGIELRR
jgi:hypothetical protein